MKAIFFLLLSVFCISANASGNIDVHINHHNHAKNSSYEIEDEYKNLVKLVSFKVSDTKSIDEMDDWVKMKRPSFVVYSLHLGKELKHKLHSLVHKHKLYANAVNSMGAQDLSLYYIAKDCKGLDDCCAVKINQVNMMSGYGQVFGNHYK